MTIEKNSQILPCQMCVMYEKFSRNFRSFVIINLKDRLINSLTQLADCCKRLYHIIKKKNWHKLYLKYLIILILLFIIKQKKSPFQLYYNRLGCNTVLYNSQPDVETKTESAESVSIMICMVQGWYEAH